jgi:hypothetical protein
MGAPTVPLPDVTVRARSVTGPGELRTRIPVLLRPSPFGSVPVALALVTVRS